MAFISDGYQCVIDINGLDLTGSLKEIEITPPSLASEGFLDTTTMRNVQYKSYQPKKLIGQSGEMNFVIQYDPKIYQVIIAQLNKVFQLAVKFPDGSAIKFYGWILGFVPNSLKEGQFTTATLKVHPSHQDKSGVNQPMVYEQNAWNPEQKQG